MARTKAATAVAEDEIEELDEVEATAEASEEAAPKKARKAKKEKPARVGLSTKDAAAQLGITPVRLRRILRSEDGGFADGDYTRYDLSAEDVERVRALIAAGAEQKAARPKKAKAEKVENAAEDVSDELDELEDLDDDEDLDLEDEDEDES